jgi:hypothetical protein
MGKNGMFGKKARASSAEPIRPPSIVALVWRKMRAARQAGLYMVAERHAWS